MVPDLSPLFQEARLIRYRRNEFILRAEDEPQGVYYIEAGLVKALTINKLGEVYIQLLYSQGEVFPLGWSLDQELRHVHFQAITDTATRRLPREAFLAAISGGGINTQLFLKYVAYYLVVYSDRVLNLEYKYAGERVVYRLLFLASRFGKQHGQKIVLDLPLTYDDIANSINLSRKSVQRELNRLVRKRLISIDNRIITILDYVAMGNELSEPVDLVRWGLNIDNDLGTNVP